MTLLLRIVEIRGDDGVSFMLLYVSWPPWMWKPAGSIPGGMPNRRETRWYG